MAVKELQRIGREVEERWPQASVAIHHRIGSLTVGELAVVIAVCTPHRQAGFEACSHTIERLKESVPIWKKEFFTDGSTWVGWGP
jgi:molybdopterin synthase catalytic subunit